MRRTDEDEEAKRSCRRSLLDVLADVFVHVEGVRVPAVDVTS